MLPILIIIAAFLLAITLTVFIFKYGIDHSVDFAINHGAFEHFDFKFKKLAVARVDRYHNLLLGLGLIFTLILVNVAIEWKTYDEKEIIQLARVEETFEDVYDIPQTTQPPPPKPTMQQPEIVAVPDEEEIEQEIEINLDVEVTDETKIEEVEKVIVEEPIIEEEVEEIFLIVQDQPEPVGGIQAFYKYLSENIRYPDEARRIGITGRVFVEFVVDKNGKLTDAKVVKGIGGGCDEEAKRVVMNAPKWNPGKQRGRPVKVRMTVPVFFQLQ